MKLLNVFLIIFVSFAGLVAAECSPDSAPGIGGIGFNLRGIQAGDPQVYLPSNEDKRVEIQLFNVKHFIGSEMVLGACNRELDVAYSQARTWFITPDLEIPRIKHRVTALRFSRPIGVAEYFASTARPNEQILSETLVDGFPAIIATYHDEGAYFSDPVTLYVGVGNYIYVHDVAVNDAANPDEIIEISLDALSRMMIQDR